MREGEGKGKLGPREEKGKGEWAGLREGWAASLYPFFFPFLFLYPTNSNKAF
jgi:hypothetical protein